MTELSKHNDLDFLTSQIAEQYGAEHVILVITANKQTRTGFQVCNGDIGDALFQLATVADLLHKRMTNGDMRVLVRASDGTTFFPSDKAEVRAYEVAPSEFQSNKGPIQ